MGIQWGITHVRKQCTRAEVPRCHAAGREIKPQTEQDTPTAAADQLPPLLLTSANPTGGLVPSHEPGTLASFMWEPAAHSWPCTLPCLSWLGLTNG